MKPIKNYKQIVTENDYYTLQPYRVIDANLNCTEVIFDALGMVVGKAVMGKSNMSEGDTLQDFNPYINYNTIREYINRAEYSEANNLLKDATSVIFYDL